jgi:hypothetical protein
MGTVIPRLPGFDDELGRLRPDILLGPVYLAATRVDKAME